MKSILLIFACLFSLSLSSAAEERPEGRFLFQPMFIWGDSESYNQGTGFLAKHKEKFYGVTSIHFLNFAKGGLFEAIWLDINTSKTVIGFKSSHGKPAKTEIDLIEDVQHDFLLLPTSKPPANSTAVEFENVKKYKVGQNVWFPNKSKNAKLGYEWIPAKVVEDLGVAIEVRFLKDIKLVSQSGSPLINADTGKVIGILMGGTDTSFYICPSRFIIKSLEKNKKPLPLMESIKK